MLRFLGYVNYGASDKGVIWVDDARVVLTDGPDEATIAKHIREQERQASRRTGWASRSTRTRLHGSLA